MNKKGNVILYIIELLAVVLIVGITVSAANSLGKSDSVIKTNTVEDFRMMVNTLVGVPGDAIVEYPHNLSKYILILNQDSISLYVKGEAKHLWVTRQFSLPEGYSAFGPVAERERVCLKKTSKTILLKECKPDEP